MIHPKVGQSVQQHGVPATEALGGLVQSREGNSETQVAHCDKRGFALGVHISSGVEVKLLPRRRLGTVAACKTLNTCTGVDKNVRGPAQKLMEEKGTNGEDWGVGCGVVGQLPPDAGLGGLLELGLAGRDEDSVTLHVVVESVVARVGKLPAEKGNKQEAVKEPACHGIDPEVGGERIVTALVGENPDTGEEKTLDKAVKRPERSLDTQRRIKTSEKCGAVEETANDDEIPHNVGERAQHRSLEALGRDRISQSLDIRHWRLANGLDGRLAPSANLGFRSSNHGDGTGRKDEGMGLQLSSSSPTERARLRFIGSKGRHENSQGYGFWPRNSKVLKLSL